MLPFFIAPIGAVILLCQVGKRQRAATTPRIPDALEYENSMETRMLLALRTNPSDQKIFGLVFVSVFLVVFSANAIIGMGLHIVLFVGSLKGVFFGVLAGVFVLYLRTTRLASRAGARI